MAQEFSSLIREFHPGLNVQDAVGAVRRVCPEMKTHAGLELIVRAFREVHFSQNMELWDVLFRLWPKEAAAAQDLFCLPSTPLPFTSDPLAASQLTGQRDPMAMFMREALSW
jgi:hypothetical protein